MSLQTYTFHLEPGGRELVSVGEIDFIYVDFADDAIEIERDNQTLTLVKGASMLSRTGLFSKFVLKNPSAVKPLRAVLTMGTDDFRRNQVEGEITVVPGIRGADGTIRDDNRHQIRMNIVPKYPAEPVTTAEGTRLARTDKQSPNPDATIQDVTHCYFIAGRVEVINQTNNFGYVRRVLDSSFNTVESEYLSYLSDGRFDGGDLKYTFMRMNITNNYIWVRSSNRTQVRYFNEGINQTLVTLPYEAPVLARIDGDKFAAFYDRNNAAVVNADKFMEVFDVAGNSLYEVKASAVDQLADFETSTHGGPVSQGFYDPFNKTWTVNAWSGGDQSGQNLAHYNEDFSKRLKVRYALAGSYDDVVAAGSSRKLYLVVGDLLVGTPDDTDYLNLWQFNAVTEEFTANVYATDQVNPLVRRDLPGTRSTYAAVSVSSAGGQTEVTGEVIKAALEIYYGAEVTGEYLDHVYSAKLPQGEGGAPFYQVQSNAGTLLASEVVDDFAAVLPGVFELTVDNGIEFKESI